MAVEGRKQGIKDAYFNLEDKWYALIDKIDTKIPVHGIIDRIDKVVPSFALFIVLIVLIAAILLLQFAGPGGLLISFSVSDTDSAAVENATVVIYVEGQEVDSDSTSVNGETKLFVLQPGTTVTVSVSKEGFLDYSETIEVTESVLLHSIVLESLEEKTYNITLKDSLGQPIREPLTLSFACRNSEVEPPEDMPVFSGIATVTEPSNCNGLIVSVRGEGYEFIDSIELVQNQQTIYLQEVIGETATINAELYHNDSPVSEQVTVYLYKDNGTEAGLGPIETVASQNGIASFERQPGTYFVKTSGSQKFAAAASQIFSVSAGEVKPVRLDLQMNVVGTIRLKIVDSITGSPVEAAKVLLRLGAQEIDNKYSSADNDAIVEFPVSQDTAYTVVVDHEAYCLKSVHDAVIGSSVREIELVPFTEDCGGTLKIKVLDQDGKPVRNATAGLYTEDGFSVGFAQLITDINGIAEFSRVPSGDYKAFAFKANSSGWSDPQHFVQRTAEKTILTVVLRAGNGLVKVNVRDDEGNPLQFSEVAFVDALTLETIGGGAMPVQDVNGSVELNTRADKWIYIVARKKDYTNFTSTVKQVIGGSTQTFNAVLEKEIIQGEIKVEFKGIYKDGKVVSVLAPGEKYEALLQLRIPVNKNYDFVGLHVRTGKHDIMELDKLVLRGINAPGNVQIIKATSYDPSNGYAVDSEHLSSDEAKWANLRWPVFNSGITQVIAEVEVKETATVGEQLDLFYRVWGEEKGVYKRNPLDMELGEAESVAGKESLYANAHQKIFQIGTETICDERFCFSASILDIEEELSYDSTDSFSGKVFRAYRLNFTILNNSEFETDSYLDSDLRISSPDSGLFLQNYITYGAQNQMREGIASGDSTEWIETGNILPNNMVSGTIEFTPQKSGLTSLVMEIRSNQRIRFRKTISMNIIAARQMDVTITPELLPSGIENSITVSVKDRVTAAELENVIVKVKDRFGTVIAEKSTNSKGITILKLPAMQPGQKLQLIAGKPDYETFETVLEVNPEVVEVKPTTIGVALNAKTVFEAQDAFSVENITSFDMQIKKVELNGKLYGLVDREKVNNWLYSYIGETIKAGQVNEMHLLSFLTEKGKKITQAKQLEASLDITMAAFGSEWVASVPVKISVGLGGEVDDPTCFAITRKEWKAGTEGVPIEIQFEAQNNCSISGTPIELRNISAKVDWETNQVGSFSIRTAENATDLRTGYYKKFSGILRPEESISIVLSFTPNAGVNGKGVATVFFSAENPTESGAQLLENRIATEITVVNLIDCIAFSKDVLLIKPDQKDSFEIETIGCGVGNSIRLDSELTLSKDKLSMGANESKEVEVFAEKNIAGQYPINIYAKGSDEVQEKLIKTVRARILGSGCLELSRYEFDVFNDPENPYDGYDSVEIINHCYEKPVTVNVKFDERDWGEAMETGAVYGLIMGVIGGFAASAQGDSFWFGPDGEGGKSTTTTAPKKNGGDDKNGEGGDDGTNILGTIVGGIGGALSWMWGGITGIFEGGGEEETDTTPDATTGDVTTPEEFPGEGLVPPADFSLGYATGQATLGYATGYESLGGGGGLLGGMLTNVIFGMGTTILGPAGFLNWGIKGFIIGTITTYMSQDEGSFSFTTIQKDLKYKEVELLMPGATLEDDKLVEIPSTDIVAYEFDPPETSTMPRPDDPRMSIEKNKLGFLNPQGVVQPDPATPLYRILRVGGERLEYKKEYDMEENKHPTLEISERKDHRERFRLQFNSFDPLAITPGPKPIPNCTLGTVTGVTGPSAVPKVAFDWTWARIEEDSCDEGNEDYIYCDATQFSIAVLKKVQELREFIEANKPFDCPSTSSGTATKEQPLTGTALDVGVTKIQLNKVGSGDINAVAVVESNNAQTMEAELTINLKQGNSLVRSCTRQFSLISKSIASCVFTDISDGTYTVEARIVPVLCAECDNEDASNDSIETDLVFGSEGVAKCEPYNTKRLAQFLGASNYSQQQIEAVQELISFNAYLMKDGYTPDFRADFDEFCKTKSFFDCPVYYMEEEGLHRFFSDSERFKFDYSLAPHVPADAGKYAVTINIEFDNENWDFFSEEMPTATINIEMTELSAPEPDNPFYYLPFDGAVGIDSENGRQGYGTNFRQTSEETIKINNTISQTILSTNIAGSTPIFNGWIDAGFSDDFGRLNQMSRGILLDVQAGSESTRMTLSPSYATPIIMQVDYEKGQDAYAFYSIEIDNSPQTAFLRLIPWSGIGVTCRDFLDNPMTEAWQDTWDKHGGISGNMRCAIGTDITDYGIEWCNPMRLGSVYLQSVVFTPQKKSSIMKRTTYSDEMILYNTTEDGSQIGLNGVPGMPSNSYGTSGVDSVEDVFELVRENKVCLIGQGSRISNRFFWNPKVILEELSDVRNQAEEDCIQTS